MIRTLEPREAKRINIDRVRYNSPAALQKGLQSVMKSGSTATIDDRTA
ncbi:MAG: hypothetical protein ACK5Q5_13595 [Planctomycetaceae bacterium]